MRYVRTGIARRIRTEGNHLRSRPSHIVASAKACGLQHILTTHWVVSGIPGFKSVRFEPIDS